MELYKEIQKSFSKIEKLFETEKDNFSIRHFICLPQSKLEMYNIRLGKWIRQNLLFEDNNLIKKFWEENIYAPHEMSLIIIKEFHSWLMLKI